jgi:hypothetical protein
MDVDYAVGSDRTHGGRGATPDIPGTVSIFFAFAEPWRTSAIATVVSSTGIALEWIALTTPLAMSGKIPAAAACCRSRPASP